MALHVLSVRMRAGLRLAHAARARRRALRGSCPPLRRGRSIRSRSATSGSRACSAPRPAPIFSYLPIKVGERVDDEKVGAGGEGAVRDRLLPRRAHRGAGRRPAWSSVQERPTISSLTFVGNKEFDTDTIKKALKDVGIAEARIFDRSALERAEQELKRQYITRGQVRGERADHR